MEVRREVGVGDDFRKLRRIHWNRRMWKRSRLGVWEWTGVVSRVLHKGGLPSFGPEKKKKLKLVVRKEWFKVVLSQCTKPNRSS